jgi:hypothetical protein
LPLSPDTKSPVLSDEARKQWQQIGRFGRGIPKPR